MTADTEVPIDLATLPSLLDRIATPPNLGGQAIGAEHDPRQRDELKSQFLRQLSRLAQRVMRADFVICRRLDENGNAHGSDVTVSSGGDRTARIDHVYPLLQSAARSGRTEIDQAGASCLIATASPNPDGSCVVLATSLDLGSRVIEPFVVTQQLLVSSIAVWDARYAGQVVEQQHQVHCLLQELRESILRSESFPQVASTIVDSIATELGAHQVAFCVRQGESLSRIQVAAVGGDGAPVDDGLWQAAASETLLRCDATRWPAKSPDDAVATIAHRALALSASPQHSAISVPLLDEEGRPFAVLAALCGDDSDAARGLSSIGAATARWVNDWRGSHQGAFRRIRRRMAACLQTRLGLVGLAVAFGLVAMWPVSYRVSTTATVVPRIRNFVVAPHSGLLRSTSVQVGDVVGRGATIAELDDRELRIELASLLAQRDRAAKQRDIVRASEEVAEEQLAEYELARVNAQIKLTNHRLNNLRVVSPIDGVVLEGELDGVNGAPVEKGQLLAEIAMLDQLWIEINTPEDELSEIRLGQQVRIAFDAVDGAIITARLDSISPSAQLRAGENAFVARALVDNPTGLLRPGITGTAKINGDERPLIAVLLRQVWRRINRLRI